MSDLPVFLILGPLLGSALFLCFSSASRRNVLILNALLCLIQLGLGGLLWMEVWRTGTKIHHLASWPAPFGIVLVADLLSASLVGVAALIAFCVSLSLFSSREFDPGRFGYGVGYQALLAGVSGVFLSGDLFNLYVWFEVMLIASFVLFIFEGGKLRLAAAFKYAVPSFLASLFFLLAAGLLYGSVGTLNLADLALKVPEVSVAGGSHPLAARTAFVFLMIAFGLKAAVFPLAFWLPASYPHLPTPTAALFAGLLTKAGLYALVRVSVLVFPDFFSSLQPLLFVLASLTMLAGVLGAVSQFEIHRILSYHIVSQIGYMLFGFSLGTQAAVSAAVFYVIHHIVVKTNLFLVSGWICQVSGTHDLKKSGGLLRHYPLLALLFALPALSLAGFPLLSGFFAKFALLKAGFEDGAYLTGAVMLLVGFLTLFSMLKIWLEAFWKPVPLRSNARVFSLLSWKHLLPLFVLTSGSLALGIYPQPLFRCTDRIAAELREPQVYIRAVFREDR